VARAAAERLTYQVHDPWFVSSLDPALMKDAVQAALNARPDLVLFEGTPMAQFAPCLPRDLPRVLDLFDVHSVMARRTLDAATAETRTALAREAARTLAFERRAARDSQACLVVSPDDAVAARDVLGALRVHLVPNGVDTAYFTPSADPPEPGAILFTGRMSYEPNADAVCHFASDVLPLVRREAPHARLHVVGVAPPPRVVALQSDAVIVHGRVDDVRPYHRVAEVVVVPVRAGGGTRLKVLEAAASGKSIVSTRLGVEGLPFHDGRDVLVADGAPDFAAAVVSLLRDPDRRQELGRRAREVACGYDWSAIGASLCDIVEPAVSHGDGVFGERCARESMR
jgi:glycosyltransferase involved in cell wall biosynthesis